MIGKGRAFGGRAVSHVRHFFESPGLWFDLLSFVFTTVGVALGVGGLWIALVQLRKKQRAAGAARAAAERTLAAVQAVTSVVELERLSGLCREVIVVVRSDHLTDALRPLHDLSSTSALSRRSGERSLTAGRAPPDRGVC